MVEFFSSLIHMLAICIICLCLRVGAVKIGWNLGLPYAMIKQGPDSGGWSIFQLIEIVPILLASLLSFMISQTGILAPQKIIIYGIGAVLISYIHMLVVLFVAG